MNISALISDNIKVLRKEKGLSQDMLGDHFDISRTTVGYIEQCYVSPTYNSLMKIASALDTNTNILCGKFSTKINIDDIVIAIVGKDYNEYFKIADNRKDTILLLAHCLKEMYNGKSFDEVIKNIKFL